MMTIEDQIKDLYQQISMLKKSIAEFDEFKRRFPHQNMQFDFYTNEALQDIIATARIMTGKSFHGTPVEAMGLELLGNCFYIIGKREEEKRYNATDPTKS
jgi:hypothetical protein